MTRKVSPDYWLYGAAMAATIFGVLAIWDAGYAAAAADGRLFPSQLLGHSLGIVGGLVLCVFFALQSPDRIRRWTPLLVILAILGLGAVLVIGKDVNGARRWIDLGRASLQPSEFAKLAVVLLLAVAMARHQPWKRTKVRHFAEWLDRVAVPKLIRAWPLYVVLLMAVLVELEPDLATSMILLATMFLMFMFGRVSGKSLLLLLAIGGFSGTLLVIKEPYRAERILNHSTRWSEQNIESIGFQTTQSETAFANGGLFGVGIGQGRAKHTLPEPINDFILATIGEELGLIGSLFTLVLLAIIAWRLFVQGIARSDRFESNFLVGMACWITVQTSVNVYMATGTFAAMGVPLPFFSSGGSSLLALWAGIGMAQAIIRSPKSKPKPDAKLPEEEPRSQTRLRAASLR